MRAWNILLILILLTSTFFFTSCGGKEEAVCTSSAECATGNPCILGRCKEGKCVNTINDNCCGNGKCEASVGESKCTCDKDCGKCEGKVKYTVETYRGPKEVEAKYAEYLCEADKCIVKVDPDSVTTPRFTNEISIRGGFEVEIVTTLNHPFDTSRDKISIRFKLKNINENVVDGISFSTIQVLTGNELIGEKLIEEKLTDIGDVFIQEITISPALNMIEAEKDLDFNFDYEYVIVERGEEVTKRATIENTLRNIMLVVP